MAYQQKDNSGSLFRNERKETDAHPNMTGTIRVAGVDYWISAWTKVKENGDRWQSLAVKPKEPKADAPAPSRRKENDGDLADDIPFIRNECEVDIGTKLERRLRRGRG